MEVDTSSRIESDVKWPSEFSELENLDTALKCGICYEFMKTAMITSCSHTYCSICIRKYLQFSQHCPVCFESSYEGDLRNNRPLDAIISLYLKINDKLLKALRVAIAASNGIPISSVSEITSEPVSVKEATPKRPLAITTPKPSGIKAFMALKPVQGETQSLKDNSPARRGLFPVACSSSPSSDSSTKPSPVLVPRMFTVSRPQQASDAEPSECVPCPICSVEIPSKNINKHLDACLSRGSNPQPKVIRKEKKLNPLPRRLLGIMSEKDLRKLMKDYGLNTKGERKVLMARAKRFTLLYNTEMDSGSPRPLIEIVAQVHREERDDKRKGCENPLFKKLSERVDRYSKPEDIEKANMEYLSDNKDHFSKLIEAMKARRKERKSSNPTSYVNLSDSENDPSYLQGSSKENLNPTSCNEEFEEAIEHTDNARNNSQKCLNYENAVPSTSYASDEDCIPGSPVSPSWDPDDDDATENNANPEESILDEEVNTKDTKENEVIGWSDDSSDESVFEIPPSQKKRNQRTPGRLLKSDENISNVDDGPSIMEPENAVSETSPVQEVEDPLETYEPRYTKRRRDPGHTSDGCISSEESIAVSRPRRNVKKIRSYSP